MVYSVTGHTLLMVSSRVLTVDEVLHGEMKQVQLLLPLRGFICCGMWLLVAIITCSAIL